MTGDLLAIAETIPGWDAGPEPLLCLGSVLFLLTVLPAGLLVLRQRLRRHIR